jgi:hypothetical protein
MENEKWKMENVDNAFGEKIFWQHLSVLRIAMVRKGVRRGTQYYTECA